jgi:hypothetical protein
MPFCSKMYSSKLKVFGQLLQAAQIRHFLFVHLVGTSVCFSMESRCGKTHLSKLAISMRLNVLSVIPYAQYLNALKRTNVTCDILQYCIQ